MNQSHKPIKWGCIADDFTGATDLAGLVRRSGLSVIQCFGIPSQSLPLEQYDVIVVALKSRSIDPDDACEQSIQAADWLAEQGANRWFYKYCSTFDSTAHGNIGPVAEALANWAKAKKTLFCPAFPENQRTVYQGHLFVGGKLLNESGMENHPLNPMKDANLVRVLSAQTRHEVGLLSLDAIAEVGENIADLDALIHSASSPFVIADAITNADLRCVARWAVDQPLVTGGSAIAGAMAARWVQINPQKIETSQPPFSWPSHEAPSVVIAGSCSLATQRQVSVFAKNYPTFAVDANAVMNDFDGELYRATHFLSDHIGQRIPMIHSTSDAESIARVSLHHDQATVAGRIEVFLSELALAARQKGATRFVVAGGETSGAVVRRLGIQAIEIGNEIAPGVPWTRSIGTEPISLALKSGNFGSDVFFEEALEIGDFS